MSVVNIRRKIRFFNRIINNYTNKLFSRSYFKAVSILNIIALINFYSISGMKAVISQGMIFIFGTILAVIISNINYEYIKKNAITSYFITFILIILVAFNGAKINGAQRWLRIDNFTLQPTEFLKLSIILIIAFYLDFKMKPNTRNGRMYNILDLFIPLMFTILPLIFVLKQPDLGTAIICLSITILILFFMGIEKKTIILILFMCGFSGFIGWKHLKVYQKDRIVNFLSPEIDSRGKSWQSRQSLIAFGSGGIFGGGIKNGKETQLKFLPEAQTDFALAALGEEHGFIAIFIVIILIYFVIAKFLHIAQQARDRFSIVVSIGLTFWIGCQTIINSAMISGLAPVVGIPCPFISYGGSSLLTLLIAIGIMTNIEHRKI